MEHEILQKANNFGFSDARFTKTENGETALVVFWAYSLAQGFPGPGKIRVTNYYIASNRSYLAANELERQLQVAGYKAQLYNEPGLKQVAARACGGIGKNTLFYHPDHGSCVAIKVLLLDTYIDAQVQQPEDFCGTCTLCREACPTGAIAEGRFTREECVRHYTGLAEIPPAYGVHIYQLMGCDLCQDCCPKNPAPDGEPHDFGLTAVLEGKHTKDIRELVGSNYGKRTAILNQALFYAANTGYTPALPAVEALLDDEFCGEAAKWAFRTLSKK